MDKEFDRFLSRFGQPASASPVSDEILERYDGKLPARLLQYWKHYGFCGFKNGLFWIVNPDDYEEALEAWIGDSAAMERDAYYVIARSAFGVLYLWGKKTGYQYRINTPAGWITEMNGHSKRIQEEGEDVALGSFFRNRVPEDEDELDAQDNPLLEPCLEKFGPLNQDECFGFVPALFAGGENNLYHIQKLNIFTHLSILAQMADHQIMDTNALIKKAF